jgi:8-oxo-dGTP diphosphatase
LSTTVSLTVDVVLFADRDGVQHVLLIQRRDEPYALHWALPGGYMDEGETWEQAGRRELLEETGLEAPDQLVHVGIYDDPVRDPRGRVVSRAYCAVLPTMPEPYAGDDARQARWIPVGQVLNGDRRLAFDHEKIISDATALNAFATPTTSADKPSTDECWDEAVDWLLNSDLGEVPQPWPKDQEPPAGINLLLDNSVMPDERNYLHRHGNAWRWALTVDPVAPDGCIGLPWWEAAREADGDLIVQPIPSEHGDMAIRREPPR